MFPPFVLIQNTTMKIEAKHTMWCVIMFDLPVKTKSERGEATKFRKLLMDCGFSMIQFSVYAKYSPSVHSNKAVEDLIRKNLPRHGEVRIFHLTDKQWASATRIISSEPVANEQPPDQLSLF